MKVLHLISGGDTGGAKTHVLSLLQELSRTQCVHLVCQAEGEMAAEARAMGLRCTVTQGGFLSSLRQVRELLSRERYDLLHCHGSRANLTGALLRGSISLPVVTTIHSDHRLDYLGRPFGALVYGTLNSLALRRMDELICVSESMRRLYEERGFSSEHLHTIYNGPDFRCAPAVWKNSLFVVPEGAVVAGAAARMDAVKDLSTLLAGFAAAAEKDPRLFLILAGSGPEEESLRTQAKRLNIENRVLFPGWVRDMDAFYSAIDINVLTSRSETFPYALTEGARFACPAVATAVGGVPDLISDGETGFLITPGDAPALAERLLRLSAEPALRHRLGEALRERVREHFSLEAMGRQQLEIYRRILRRRGIVVLGACGQGNLGDELMLASILRTVRSTAEELPVTVISRSPRETERLHEVKAIHSFAFFRLRRLLRRSRLLIAGGGNLLQDSTSRRSLSYYLCMLRLARRSGCRTILYGAGLGPLTAAGEERVRRCLARDVDAAAFREEASLQMVAVGGTELLRMADPVLCPVEISGEQRYELFVRCGLDPARRWMAVCVRQWRGEPEQLSVLAQTAAAFAAEENLGIAVIAMNRRRDAAVSGRLAERLPGAVMVPAVLPEDAAALFGGMELVVSMRLHALVLAVNARVPCVGLAWDERIPSLLAEHGVLSLPCRELQGNELAAAMKAALRCPPVLAAADSAGPDFLRRELQRAQGIL